MHWSRIPLLHGPASSEKESLLMYQTRSCHVFFAYISTTSAEKIFPSPLGLQRCYEMFEADVLKCQSTPIHLQMYLSLFWLNSSRHSFWSKLRRPAISICLVFLNVQSVSSLFSVSTEQGKYGTAFWQIGWVLSQSICLGSLFLASCLSYLTNQVTIYYVLLVTTIFDSKSGLKTTNWAKGKPIRLKADKTSSNHCWPVWYNHLFSFDDIYFTQQIKDFTIYGKMFYMHVWTVSL